MLSEAPTEACNLAREAGTQIMARFEPALDRKERLKVLAAFRRTLFPPGQPGRKRRKEITAAHADWKAGIRGVRLYQRHIPGFDRMSRWKRRAKMQTLMDAIHTRERRERNRLHGEQPSIVTSTPPLGTGSATEAAALDSAVQSAGIQSPPGI
jgi:hypothetical protein